MVVVFYLLVSAVVLCMLMSIKALFSPLDEGMQKISLSHFIWLAFLYGTICIGFALLYLLLEMRDMSVILDNGIRLTGDFFLMLETSIYFSTMTMFSVGYGDLTPIGIGRMIATVQAFVGYVLPAAFFVRTVIEFDHVSKR
ncbi:ion channel [Bacillus testis]|uniref:ion channel n=1 Tax=Bacillus testis TaxID=1622072 RepID=UPI001E5256F2|nr:ion channel [Bacillus testis]